MIRNNFKMVKINFIKTEMPTLKNIFLFLKLRCGLLLFLLIVSLITQIIIIFQQYAGVN